jgi:Calreticulin family
VKLLDFDAMQDLKSFSKDTGYLLMFGPDFCDGNAELKLAFRKGGSEYKQWKRYLVVPSDTRNHLYTLIWRSNGKYEVKIDNHSKVQGNILEDFDFESLPSHLAKEKPDNWDDKPYVYNAQLEEELKKYKPLIEDENDVQPLDWNIHT